MCFLLTTHPRLGLQPPLGLTHLSPLLHLRPEYTSHRLNTHWALLGDGHWGWIHRLLSCCLVEQPPQLSGCCRVLEGAVMYGGGLCQVSRLGQSHEWP